MEPTVTARLIPANVESPATDTPDFEEVVQLYRPRIFRFVLASVRDRDVAETLTQDCFWRAYRGWSRFRGDSSVHTWLMHIAVNLVRDFARNRRIQFWRRAPIVNPADVCDWIPDRHMSPEASAVVKDQVQAVWKATERLSAKQRTVFLLRFVEDMDLMEIAAATGMTEGTVKVHLFRAVHAIRERLRRSQ
jgi:RNA polymerase sigma-70 factor, ECF subfamily